MWEERVTQESKRSCENNEGKWKNNNCYRYRIVTQLCFYVTEESNNHDIEEADRWRVTRGCYEHNEYRKMIPAIPDLRYGFS
jgi:hypothetical protein